MIVFRLIIIWMSVASTGCVGTMLDGRVCTFATDETIQRDVRELVDLYTPASSKDDAERYLTKAGLTASALCEIRRAAAAAAASKDSRQQN